jgi:hypothetical protein
MGQVTGPRVSLRALLGRRDCRRGTLTLLANDELILSCPPDIGVTAEEVHELGLLLEDWQKHGMRGPLLLGFPVDVIDQRPRPTA